MAGQLTVVTGTMFSGKTDELIRRLRKLPFAGLKSIVFSPEEDGRSPKKFIESGNGETFPAHNIPVTRPKEMIGIIMREEEKSLDPFSLVALDEAQLFPRGSDINNILVSLVHEGRNVVVSGLDLDFRGEPFGVTPELMARADKVIKLGALCTLCGKEARYSQRFIDEIVAPWDDPQIKIGGEESYGARCRNCFVIPP